MIKIKTPPYIYNCHVSLLQPVESIPVLFMCVYFELSPIQRNWNCSLQSKRPAVQVQDRVPWGSMDPQGRRSRNLFSLESLHAGPMGSMLTVLYHNSRYRLPVKRSGNSESLQLKPVEEIELKCSKINASCCCMWYNCNLATVWVQMAADSISKS